ncbi:MAG TPA: TonB-dependent receptor [Candidatus Bacteroides merdigallinarum]|uniref:TonB-dependent receptor n=1 Tax=Candidatus Bacteroides merdigallinarum TaxID=2838473 RepID=A0A9D2E982_9BACE|nr:TonB-dependent receptor [Candidatus Bacteroides merdigallinarum]
MKKLLSVLFLLSLTLASVYAQDIQVKGTVVSGSDDFPLPGVNVVVKGTTKGVITDLDGNFTISVPSDAVLTFTYIGFKTQEVAVNGKTTLNVVLDEDTETLEEVVVVGYGVQKKSVVTASIAKVSADDLENKAPVRMDNALKGLAAGVDVTSASGQPGASPRVRIRGIGTINNSDPLYIVDGMPISGGLDFVNPNDIESIEVLKDAASGAIYGARAANGVILVTTKKGKLGKTSINYNFSYGWQSAWKRRDVTCATDYAILQNEKYMNGGQAPLYADPYNLTDINGNPVTGFGTDWQDAVFNDGAPVVNHDVTISGATEKVNYYLSLGYYSQEGIVGGNYGQSNYDRLTLRSNTSYNLIDASKERSFLNKLDLSVNVAYMRTHSTGVSENSEFGSILGSALYLSPILPITVSGAAADELVNYYETADPNNSSKVLYELPRDPNGNIYTVPGYFGSYNEMNNPLAMMTLNPQKNYSHKFVPKFSIDLQLWDNLKYHFSYSADMSFWGYDAATVSKFYLSGNNNASHTSATANRQKNMTWQIENTLTYDKTFGKHTIGVVLGQSALKYKGDQLGGSRWNLVNPLKPSIDYATGNVVDGTAQFSVYGAPFVEHTMASMFGRLSYNYDERYMVQATVRRDGSSRFGPNNKYGIFPSFSAGWNVMNEAFMEGTRDWLSNLKIRFSWGKNGNDNIADFGYTSLTAMGNNVLFGKDAIKWNGSKASRLSNPDLKWEESEQTDIGIDLGFFNGALTASIDYYIKKTNGMIIEMPIPSYVGETKPLGNVGDMENKGVEFELGYKWNIADAHFSVKGNATYLKNTLKNLGNDTGYIDLDGIQGLSGGGTRGSNGQPFPYFFGYKTAGVFQNVAEVQAYTNKDGGLIMPDAVPGDVRFVDVNGDGQITADDRTNIGNGTPDWTYGLNLNADWKGFDFNIFFQGVAGNEVFDGTFRSDVTSGNYPSWMLGRWTGEGTSNKYPRLALGDDTNWQVSDLYVCDGSYFRLKNITLGYTLPQNLTRKVCIERLRIYFQAENLATWTKYWGFDPEISSGATSLGVDRGVYPQARTFTIGANISF